MSLSTSRAKEILGAFTGRRVLVVGDMAVDEHRIGSATRISRESPVPVPLRKWRRMIRIEMVGGDVRRRIA